MKRRFDDSQPDQHAPEPEPTAVQAPLTGQEIGPLDVEPDPLSADIPQMQQVQQSNAVVPDSAQATQAGEAKTVTDQPSKPLLAVRSSPPTKFRRPVRFVPQSDPQREEIAVTDQETKPLNALPRPAAVEFSQAVSIPQPPELAGEKVSITDQETRSLQVAPALLSAKTSQPAPFSGGPDQQVAEAVVMEQETRSLTIIRASTPARSVQESYSAQKEDRTSLAEQETRSLAAFQLPVSAASPQAEASPAPGFLWRMIRVGLTRLQEPQPEGPLTRGIQAVSLEARLGLVPLLALTNAFGLFMICASYYLSVWEYSYPVVESCFLGGLLLMFVPNVMRLLSRAPQRLERICLLCVLGLVSYFVQFMSSPLALSSFDDFLHWRTVIDILRSGHLFSVNSMLPVSPYYPGLEIVTAAISSTTGLSAFQAGVIVTMAAHFLMVLALYLFYEHITNSSRMAGIALMIYMANPHFLFFDTIYSYETLALPLAILMIYILARYGNADKNYRWIIVAAWIVLAAVTVTHHMTNYIFDGLLLLWAVISFFRPVSRGTRIYMAAIAISGILLSLAYAFFLPGNPVWGYLSDYFSSAFNQLGQIISGSSSARPLFASAVQPPPLWDKLLITGSIALVTFSLPFGLLSLQRLHRNNALAVTLGLASLLYPLTQAFRFTSFGTEITDRAAAFLFLPIAYALTILLTHFWPTRQLTRRTIALIGSAILVILLGNTIVATSPNLTGIPGPYLVVADARSIEPEGINAALWSQAYLGPDNRVAADRINQMLQSTYGDQRIMTRLNDNIDVAPLFYSASFDKADIALLQVGQIRYLVVDTRISTALPLEGTYFENDVPHSIISRDALTKFNAVTQINRLFDSGDIVIYDTGAFLAGSGP